MTQLLIRLFVKDADRVTDPKVRERYGLLGSAVGMACNVALFLIKLVIGTLSGSVAIMADAFNNLSDVGSAVMTLLGFKIAAKPADSGHPFGHGRAEYISGLVIAFLIVVVGFEFLRSSVDKILHPEPVSGSAFVIAALAASILVKLWLSRFGTQIGKRIGSTALAASATDALSDVAATSATLVSVIVSYFTRVSSDGYMGAVVSLFVLWAGWKVAMDAVGPLMGQRPDPELVAAAEALILGGEGIVGMHDLMVHSYGPGKCFASAHAEVRSDADMMQIHDVIDQLERKAHHELGMLLTLHLDPLDVDDRRTEALRGQVQGVVQAIHPALGMHDFRIVSGETHTNLIFDVLVPQSVKLTDREIIAQLRRGVKRLDSRVEIVVTVDHGYV